MKLSTDQERVVEDWIHKKIEHCSCDLCQANQWRVGELLMSPDREPANGSGAMVQWICQNCGHVVLFDASRIAEWRSVDSLTDVM